MATAIAIASATIATAATTIGMHISLPDQPVVTPLSLGTEVVGNVGSKCGLTNEHLECVPVNAG